MQQKSKVECVGEEEMVGKPRPEWSAGQTDSARMGEDEENRVGVPAVESGGGGGEVKRKRNQFAALVSLFLEKENRVGRGGERDRGGKGKTLHIYYRLVFFLVPLLGFLSVQFGRTAHLVKSSEDELFESTGTCDSLRSKIWAEVSAMMLSATFLLVNVSGFFAWRRQTSVVCPDSATKSFKRTIGSRTIASLVATWINYLLGSWVSIEGAILSKKCPPVKLDPGFALGCGYTILMTLFGQWFLFLSLMGEKAPAGTAKLLEKGPSSKKFTTLGCGYTIFMTLFGRWFLFRILMGEKAPSTGTAKLVEKGPSSKQFSTVSYETPIGDTEAQSHSYVPIPQTSLD